MDLKTQLEAILGAITILQKTDKGLTNDNYYAATATHEYMVRVPRFDADQIVHRAHEAAAMDVLKNKGYDVPIVYYDKQSGLKISEYIHDAKEYHTCDEVDKLEQVAALLRRFHHENFQTPYTFDPYERYVSYRSHIQKPTYDLSAYEPMMKQTAADHSHFTLCHNDLVDGNLLFTKQQLYLIDYEYAAMNDPYFDVISFLSENQIYDPLLRERFYHVYFNAPLTRKQRQRLFAWEVFEDVLWATWAMMMAEHRQEAVYHEIAHEKVEALQCLDFNLLND